MLHLTARGNFPAATCRKTLYFRHYTYPRPLNLLVELGYPPFDFKCIYGVRFFGYCFVSYYQS